MVVWSEGLNLSPFGLVMQVVPGIISFLGSSVWPVSGPGHLFCWNPWPAESFPEGQSQNRDLGVPRATLALNSLLCPVWGAKRTLILLLCTMFLIHTQLLGFCLSQEWSPSNRILSPKSSASCDQEEPAVRPGPRSNH